MSGNGDVRMFVPLREQATFAPTLAWQAAAKQLLAQETERARRAHAADARGEG